MKIISFSTNRNPILSFEAEHTEFTQDAGAYVIQAMGEITFQDTPLLEEFLHGERDCQLRVTEGNTELLNGSFTTTFLHLEMDGFVVRLEDNNKRNE